MDDKEFDNCERELKKYLNKSRIGKLVLKELNVHILGTIFRQGYKLGKKQNATNK